MGSNYKEWYIQLHDSRKNRAMSDSTGVYSVLTANSAVALTCYSDAAGTSLTQPGTMSNGVIKFFTANTTTSLDLTLLTADGHAAFISDLTPSDHVIRLDPEVTEQTLIIPYALASTVSDVAVATGYSLPTNAMVYDCIVHVYALGTSAGMAVGVSGTPTGFLINSALVSAVGFTPIMETPTTAAFAKGALLATAVTVGFVRQYYVPPTATAVVYANHATGTAVGTGYIYIMYKRAHTNTSTVSTA